MTMSSLVILSKSGERPQTVADLDAFAAKRPDFAAAQRIDALRWAAYVRSVGEIDEANQWAAFHGLTLVSPLLEAGETARAIIQERGLDSGAPGFVVLVEERLAEWQVFAGRDAEAELPAQDGHPTVRLRPLSEAPVGLRRESDGVRVVWPDGTSWGVVALPPHVFAWTAADAMLEMLARRPTRLEKKVVPHAVAGKSAENPVRRRLARAREARLVELNRATDGRAELEQRLLLAAALELRQGRSAAATEGVILAGVGWAGPAPFPEPTELDHLSMALGADSPSPVRAREVPIPAALVVPPLDIAEPGRLLEQLEARLEPPDSELRLLRVLADGAGPTEAAKELGITPSTARTTRGRLASRAQAKGLIPKKK